MDKIFSGRVTANGAPLGLVNAQIEAWDLSASPQRPVAVAQVRPGGTFSMALPEQLLDSLRESKRPLEFRVLYQGALLRLAKPVQWKSGDRMTDLDMVALADGRGRDIEAPRTVSGQVVLSAAELPAAGLVVRAFDRDLRGEEQLGEGRTDRNGRYVINYDRSQFARSEKETADLIVRVFDGSGQQLLYEPPLELTLFNAGSDVTVDIRLDRAPPRSRSEFETVQDEIAPLLGKVEPAEIAENDSRRDVTFLSREARLPAAWIVHFAMAARLAALTKIDAAPFYALLRMDTLLARDPVPQRPTLYAIGINDDPKLLLLRAALIEPERVERDISQAVEDKIAPAGAERQVSALLKVLSSFKKEAGAWEERNSGRTVAEAVEPLVRDPGRLEELLDLAQTRGPEFSEKMTALVSTFSASRRSDIAEPPEERRPADLSLPQVVKSAKLADDPAALAALSRDEWRKAIRKADPKAPKERLEMQARSFALEAEQAHPASALRARIERGEITLRDSSAALRMLEDEQDLDLRSANLSQLFKTRKMEDDEHADTRADLSRIQRVLKIAPDIDRAVGLMAQNIGSAADVLSTGRARFLSDVAPSAGLSPAEASAIYAKAEAQHAGAMMVAGEMQALSGAAAAATAPLTLPPTELDASKKFPNLVQLFGSPSLCACTQCRSVFSPAAYLVELLEFLGRRSMVDLTQTPPAKVNLARHILFERRGEIADLDLNCENAETPLPYIDLVCELLEEAVSPDPGVVHAGAIAPGVVSAALLATLTAAGWPVTAKAIVQAPDLNGDLALRDAKFTAKLHDEGGGSWRARVLRQTHSTAPELRAAPEYVNADAYVKLKGANYAFALPFDLNHVEASAYFARFGLSRAQLMRDYAHGGTPADEEIAAEGLNLSDAVRALIVTPAPAAQADIWALPAASVVTEMAVVQTMLDKTGLTYAELDRMLQLPFVDPGDVLFIKHLDLSCDLTQKRVAGLDDQALDRMHRFLRIRRATGWADTVVDAAIEQPAIGQGVLDDAALIRLEEIARIAARTGLKPAELTACFGDIPHTPLTGTDEPTQYARIFLNKAVLGRIEDGLRPDAISAGGTISALAPSIATLLKLSAADFERLRAAITDDQLTYANLSRLYCSARLCDRLKLKPADLLILVRRTGIDPWTGPGAMLAFLDHAAHAKSSPVKIADLPFMLEHGGADAAKREVSDSKITTFLTGLQSAYQSAFAQARTAVSPDMTAEELRPPIHDALLRLPGLTEEEAATVLRMYDAKWTSPPDPAAAATLASLFDEHFDTTALAGAQAVVAAAAPAALEAARVAMAGMLLDAIAASLFERAKRGALVTALAGFARQPAERIEAVLSAAKLRQPGPAEPLVEALLTDNALVDMTGEPPVPPAISEIAFADQFKAVRLLHKLLPLAAATGLGTEDLQWVLGNSTAMGWPGPDAIPYRAGQAAIGQAGWERLTRSIALFAAFPPTADPADPAASVTLAATLDRVLPGAATTRAEWIDALALLSGSDRTTLDELDTELAWSTPNLDAWRLPETWDALTRCLADLRTLGATTAMAVAWTKANLDAADTAALRTALKARYDEGIWLTTLGEITDSIRPKKRDALVGFLLAVTDWTTPSDIYDFYLIDPLMESKVATSRIVQAHGVLQLFVERSRMGLEPAAAADAADVGWDQWAWMKNFQVWVANRKIFVNPENWVRPELLDDKSSLFAGLESDLLQNEVNEFTTEDAYIRYLEGLDAVSFLEVVAVYYQDDIRTMHVFARTKGGDPAQYYHRTFKKERIWSPWELVELDITSDSLLAFVRNRRLHLAWPVVSQETNPNQQVSVPPVSNTSSTVSMQHAEARMRIQLAVSEYTNGSWKPRKISQDAVLSPQSFTTDQSLLDGSSFNLMYHQFGDQIWLFRTKTEGDYETHELKGIFDVRGCKSYPEFVSNGGGVFDDFYPDYKDTLLKRQRFFEQGLDKANTLAIRNILTFWGFVVRLDETPGRFRVTHALQFTLIDLFYLLLQFWFRQQNGGNTFIRDYSIKIPFGTWLPYFYEDSERAYVVVPGLYPVEGDEPGARRTFSDFLDLLEAVIALIAKYLPKLQAVPAPDPNDILAELLADRDYLYVRDELKTYSTLRYGEQFRNLYHPLICPLRATLYKSGVGAMMSRSQQLSQTGFDFAQTFKPTAMIAAPYPVEDVDFRPDGSYSLYNWELFFHAPLMIANRLASEQKFEEAMVWYHRIFDPTGTLEGTIPQKYWVTRPFFETTAADYAEQRIDTLLTSLADPLSPDRFALEQAVADWRDKPFRPHVVARYRTTAYQRTVVMNYIKTLTDWGDYLFRQDTMESVTQATQLYLLAEKLLGPKPRIVPSPVEAKPETYWQLAADLDALGNALVQLENYLPDLSILPEGGAELPAPPATLASLYFGVPPNEKALATWDLVADRLLKIRNSQNIDGIERVLALFAPPIDPEMLVRAAAAGLDLSSVLAGLNAPLPAYRFQVMVGKAADFAGAVQQLGNELLTAIEKKDAEGLAVLRSDLEVKLLKAQRDLKILAIDAAKAEIETIKRSREITDERHSFYAAFTRINANEQLNLDKMGDAAESERNAGIVRATGAVLGIIPDFAVGAHGAGGSPALHASFGGSTLAHVADAAAGVLSIIGGVASYEASRAAALGSFDRRYDDAGLQERTAKLELKHIDQQLVAAELRRDIATKELSVHDVQIDNGKKLSDALTSKYSNTELYQWMVDDVTSIYYQAYQLAYATAKKAERCYQHEIGSTESFLAFGYWNSRKKGLLTANKLLHDIRRMEARYYEVNQREYEVTKHVSLRQLDPLALMKLRSTGSCDFELPEALFDLDHAGQYFRRIESIAVSFPAIAGPYVSVSAKLTQVSNRYRTTTAPAAGAGSPQEEYEEAATPAGDTRFVYNVGSSQSIATSSGQNDSGLFQLDFRDERYLPFEGTGAISSWRLELPDPTRQFDYLTISDVIVHVRYTAREGGSSLKSRAKAALIAKLQEMKQGLAKTGLHSVIDLKRDDYDAWYLLKSSGTATITIKPDRLPYFVQPLAPTIGPVTLLAKVAGDPASYSVSVDGTNIALGFNGAWGFNLNDVAGLALDTPTAFSVAAPALAALEELVLMIKIDTP